jgi:5-methyltetrahydrofolate--homocysteine methyltransferase
MNPPAAVAGFYLAHPEAKYFAIPKIGEDQVADWMRRNPAMEAEAQKWLGSLL